MRNWGAELTVSVILEHFSTDKSKAHSTFQKNEFMPLTVILTSLFAID